MKYFITNQKCLHRSLSFAVVVSIICLGTCLAAKTAGLVDNICFKTGQKTEREIVALPRITIAPKLDGDLKEDCWKDAWKGRFAVGSSNWTELAMMYDAENLYLGAKCAVSDIKKLKTACPAGMRSSGTWGDDCIDFKISPYDGGPIYQFLVSAAGSYDNYRDGDNKWNPVWTNTAKIGGNEYVVELTIPFKEIGLKTLKSGTTFLLNFGRTDRTGYSGEGLSSLAAPYGELRAAPLFVLGTQADYQALLNSSTAISTNATIDLYLDRDQYPSFQKLAVGRIRINSGTPQGGTITTNVALLLSLIKSGREIGQTIIKPLPGTVLDFDLPMDQLVPGAYELQATLKTDQEIIRTKKKEFIVQERKAQKSGRIPITVPDFPGNADSWPLTFGIPFPWGALDSEDNVRLIDDKENEVPIQTQVTCRWSQKGSIRWLLVDCLAPARREEQKLTLIYGPDVRRSGAQKGLKIEQNDEQIAIDTGAARFVMPKHNTPGLSEVWLDKNADGIYQPNERLLNSDRMFGPYLVDEAGKKYLGSGDRDVEVVLESAGPLKACVRVSGWHVAETGERLGKYILRYYIYAGQPYVRVYHTFIITASSNADTGGTREEARYRDIAYSLPFGISYGFLGTPTIYPCTFGKSNSVYLVQRSDTSCQIYKDNKFDDECEKAEGWMSIGRPGAMLTVTMKDFWQNYPKEYEVTPQEAIIHFWPAHNTGPVHTLQNTSIRNVYPLWFVHEGKVLDFKVPKEVLDIIMPDEKTKKVWEENNPGAPVANAIGLAKTHEFLLYFHNADWEKARSRTVSRLFQSNPTATCDPKWVCDSGVFGTMAARDQKKFPAIERAVDETVACIFRQQAFCHDYGMFNYGDAHHNWILTQRCWENYRIWRNTHHGWTRWPWLQYAHSGEKELFNWADRNARHVADIDHCHYTTKEFSALNWPKGKIVGGICDYKGFVHWSSGNRLCYNSIADSMLQHYYFTGDERSHTTALEHGAALIADGSPQGHREGAGRATSACELYFYTWDNDYLEFLEKTIDCLLKTQGEDGSFPQWENFAPFLQRYVDLTQSRRGMQAMARWAGAPYISIYNQAINVRSYAYLYTGDIKYLRKAAYDVHSYVDTQYLGEDPWYRGGRGDNMMQSYFLQWIPYYLSAVNRYGKEPEPELPKSVRLESFLEEEVNGKKMCVFHARLRQKEDKPFKLRLRLNPPCFAEISGQGKILFSASSTNADMVELNVPADGVKEYDLRVAHDGGRINVHLPFTADNDDLQEVYAAQGRFQNILGGMRFYFDLPEGVKSFLFSYSGGVAVNQFEVFDSNGKPAGGDSWMGYNNPYVHQLKCLVSDSGKGWSFSGAQQVHDLKVEPAALQKPFYFSTAREKLFAPSW